MADRKFTRRIGWGLSLLLSVAALAVGMPHAGLLDCDSVSVRLYSGSVHTPVTTAIDADLKSQLTLTCASTSNDDIIWFKDGREIATSFSNEYKIDAVLSDHGGQYQCGVDVKSCGMVKSGILIVNTPPQTSILVGESTVTEGESFSLTCQSTGWPAPYVQWSLGDHVIHTGQQYTVHSARLSDSGQYTCTAKNSRGTANSTRTLHVQAGFKSRHLLSTNVTTTDTPTSPSGRGGGNLTSGSFIAIILVCAILAFAMIIVIIVVSLLCCVAAVKNFRQWLISRKTGDKAHLISPGDDELSEEGSPGQARKNGSVAMAGVAAALTNEDSKINAKSEKQKKKKPKAGFKSKKVKPQMESDEIPIITHVDDPLIENEPSTINGNDKVIEESTQLVNGDKDAMELSTISDGNGGRSSMVQIEAEVLPDKVVAMTVTGAAAASSTPPEGERKVAEKKEEETPTLITTADEDKKKEEEAGPTLITTADEDKKEEEGSTLITTTDEDKEKSEGSTLISTPEEERKDAEEKTETPALTTKTDDDKKAAEEKVETTSSKSTPEEERKVEEKREEPPPPARIPTPEGDRKVEEVEKKQPTPAATPEEEKKVTEVKVETPPKASTPEGEKKVAEKKEEETVTLITTADEDKKATETSQEATAESGAGKEEEKAPPTAAKRVNEEELKEKARKIGRSVSFVEQLSKSRPLNMAEISELVYGQANKDSSPLFQEYNSIPQNTPTLDQSPAEKARNRYRNVLPNPHSAVKLIDLGDPGSTYINANYIQGYKKENAYIVTQGPTADTMTDFWRMIWEQNVSLIVMLTGIVERGRHKCAKYWPSTGTNDNTGTMEYGYIRVHSNSEEAGDYFNVSNLTITNTEQGSADRQVYHFAYKAWPDFGVPKESIQLLKLVEEVNKYRNQQQSEAPLVVHCSAGLGRSGAFMAIDTGIHQYEKEAQVDPLKYFCDMRMDRGGSIQTPEQYVFIHKALADYMMEKAK